MFGIIAQNVNYICNSNIFKLNINCIILQAAQVKVQSTAFTIFTCSGGNKEKIFFSHETRVLTSVYIKKKYNHQSSRIFKASNDRNVFIREKIFWRQSNMAIFCGKDVYASLFLIGERVSKNVDTIEKEVSHIVV